MKIITKITTLLLIITLISSCSSDNGDATPQEATIDSYSKNYGYVGEHITIHGTNFTPDIDKVNVFFDEITAEINSVNNQEINITLPNSTNTIPVLKVEIENRIITNNVINAYNNFIGILQNSLNQWHSIEKGFDRTDEKIKRTQTFGNDRAYFSFNKNIAFEERPIYRTIDGGLTWDAWTRTYSGAFYATINDEGWNDHGSLNRVPVGGGFNFILDRTNFYPETIIATYVNENMQEGTIITSDNIVFKTTDGINFNEVYNNSNPGSTLWDFFALDNNHIWAGGHSLNSGSWKPLLLFINNGIWQELELSLPGNNYRVGQIQFINPSIGFIEIISIPTTTAAKIYKTLDGGNTWQIILDEFEFEAFCFKNETTGWLVKGNEIYRTIDGGSTWSLDYTNTSTVKSISYDNGVVWAISRDKILKYFTE
jgi:hypothetical protein